MMMPGSGEGSVRGTGGQVDEMVMALIDAAYDKDPAVQNAVSTSLLHLGRKQPSLVLSSCHSYLLRHAKLPQGHRVRILNCMESTLSESLTEIEQSLAADIILLASNELTQLKEVVPAWQGAASGVLVAIGMRFCTEVMSALLPKVQPGYQPHFMVVRTLAKLTAANSKNGLVYDMVPFLKVLLGTMLPMLGMIKQENMRWAFANALARFCEAIVEYTANLEKAPDKHVTKSAFSSEVDASFDVLLAVWLNTKEAKLRVAIVEALGYMTYVMSRNKMEESFPRLFPAIISLYKRSIEPYHVTVGLFMVLDAAIMEGSSLVEQHYDSLYNILFTQVSQPVDYSKPMTLKNHNEILRCYAVLAFPFSARLVSSLLQRLESQNERQRCGVLAVLRHLVNSAGSSMENKKPLLLSGLKVLLSETNNTVKKILAQTIIAMAHHGYLQADGGHVYIEFIVHQCALTADDTARRPTDPDHISNSALRSMCDNVLQLLSTTVEDMDQVLWPYLLQCLMYCNMEAMGAICKAIGHIAAKKRTENAGDYEVDFSSETNLPKPAAIIAKLLVMAGRPQNGRNRGIHVLAAMKAISPVLHARLTELWDTVIPKLMQYLEDAYEKGADGWCQKSWEDLLLKLLSKTLDEVGNDTWTRHLGNAFGHQVASYSELSEEKNFLYKCLGVVLRKTTTDIFVRQHLHTIFDSVNHSRELEREGCAIAVGFAAASHLDTALEVTNKHEMAGNSRSSGIIGFIKDQVKSDSDERPKATVILCYGYITLYAPVSLVCSRMETVIRKCVTLLFSSVKDLHVKQSLIKMVDLIARAMHPSHLRTEYIFSSRNDLLSHMQLIRWILLQTFLVEEIGCSPLTATPGLLLKTCASLIQLNPRLTDIQISELFHAALTCCLPLPPGGATDELARCTISALSDFFETQLMRDCSPSNLYAILQTLFPWMKSESEQVRLRSLQLCLKMLKSCIENMPVGGCRLSHMGPTLAYLVPRCSDPNIEIRETAVDCVRSTLELAAKLDGHSSETDSVIGTFPTLQEKLKRDDPNALFDAISDLGKVMAKKVTPVDLSAFLDGLLDALVDPLPQSSSGACVVLNAVVKARGSELYSQAESLLSSLHARLSQITCTQTRTGTVRVVRTLTSHHLLSVIPALLKYPLPFDENTAECWRIMGQDQQLTASVISHALEVLANSVPYDEVLVEDMPPKRTATLLPVAITCALSELFNVEETSVEVMNNYPRLFSAMLVRIASTVGVQPPIITKAQQHSATLLTRARTTSVTRNVNVDPLHTAIDACHRLLTRNRSDDLVTRLDREGVWQLLAIECTAPDGFALLARCVAQIEPQYVAKLIACLNPIAASVYQPQRVMVAAMFAEFVATGCAGDSILVDMLVGCLLGWMVDTSRVVRRTCVRGLGNIAALGTQQVQKYATTVLSAMLTGMDDADDQDDTITLEAISGLSRVLKKVNEGHVRAILINIALRIRPSFEKEQASVRAAAFTLFGDLSRFGDGPSRDNFVEQIHTNLVCFILHLNDPDDFVKRACKQALHLLGPLIGSSSTNEMFQKHLLPDAQLIYGEFINGLAKVMLQDFQEKLNFYVMSCVTFFRSHWPEIRSNAALLTGFLLGNLDKSKHHLISKEHVCAALMLLLKDSNPEVRTKAVEAMSLLHTL